MKGILTYWVKDGADTLRSVKLTLCSEDDFGLTGTSKLRRKRLVRILEESCDQNVSLSYRDLAMILLVSRSTIKRDFSHLRSLGVGIPARRKNV